MKGAQRVEAPAPPGKHQILAAHRPIGHHGKVGSHLAVDIHREKLPGIHDGHLHGLVLNCRFEAGRVFKHLRSAVVDFPKEPAPILQKCPIGGHRIIAVYVAKNHSRQANLEDQGRSGLIGAGG